MHFTTVFLASLVLGASATKMCYRFEISLSSSVCTAADYQNSDNTKVRVFDGRGTKTGLQKDGIGGLGQLCLENVCLGNSTIDPVPAVSISLKKCGGQSGVDNGLFANIAVIGIDRTKNIANNQKVVITVSDIVSGSHSKVISYASTSSSNLASDIQHIKYSNSETELDVSKKND